MKVWLVPAAAWVLCDAALASLVLEIGFDRYALRVIVMAQLISTLAVLVVIGLGAALTRRVTPALCALALTAGAVAIFPWPVEYSSDGCNDTTGYSYAATAAYVEHVEPEDTRVMIDGVQTLMACL